jgi:hypothetical protein
MLRRPSHNSALFTATKKYYLSLRNLFSLLKSKKTENSMNEESEMERERQESMFSSHKDTRQQIKTRNVSEKVEEWEEGGARETVKLNIEIESVRKKFDLSQCMINSAS